MMNFFKQIVRNKSWGIRLLVLVAVCLLANLAFHYQVDARDVPKDEVFMAKVVSVGDGDTLSVMGPDNQRIKLRLASIDAPEYKQDFGKESRDYLNQMVYGKTIRVQNLGQDPYHRMLAKIWYQDKDVQLVLIEEGMVWHYAYFARKQQSDAEFKQYELAQKQAKAWQVGLWQNPKAISPWDFKRNELKKNKPKSNY